MDKLIRGIYTGATGMLSQSRRLDVVANNLANVNTAGFKKDTLRNESFPEVLMYRLAQGPVTPIGTLGPGTDTPTIHTDFTRGIIVETSNPFDLALEGPGFFSVETPNGERYTRNGHFLRDAAGYLVNQEGYYLLGQNGRIQVAASAVVEVSQDGRVVADGQVVDALRIVGFLPGLGVKEGHSLWLADQVAELPAPTVRQGAIERSNVNIVQEMVDMIGILRAYEANQKVITTQDELLGKAVNEVGRT